MRSLIEEYGLYFFARSLAESFGDKDFGRRKRRSESESGYVYTFTSADERLGVHGITVDGKIVKAVKGKKIISKNPASWFESKRNHLSKQPGLQKKSDPEKETKRLAAQEEIRKRAELLNTKAEESEYSKKLKEVLEKLGINSNQIEKGTDIFEPLYKHTFSSEHEKHGIGKKGQVVVNNKPPEFYASKIKEIENAIKAEELGRKARSEEVSKRRTEKPTHSIVDRHGNILTSGNLEEMKKLLLAKYSGLEGAKVVGYNLTKEIAPRKSDKIVDPNAPKKRNPRRITPGREFAITREKAIKKYIEKKKAQYLEENGAEMPKKLERAMITFFKNHYDNPQRADKVLPANLRLGPAFGQDPADPFTSLTSDIIQSTSNKYKPGSPEYKQQERRTVNKVRGEESGYNVPTEGFVPQEVITSLKRLTAKEQQERKEQKERERKQIQERIHQRDRWREILPSNLPLDFEQGGHLKKDQLEKLSAAADAAKISRNDMVGLTLKGIENAIRKGLQEIGLAFEHIMMMEPNEIRSLNTEKRMKLKRINPKL